MKHPNPCPMQDSSQCIGQADELPTGVTACRGVGFTAGSRWNGEEWQKMIKRTQSHINRLPVSMIGHVVYLITSLLIKLNFSFPGWQGAPFHVCMCAQRSKRQQMKREPQIIGAMSLQIGARSHRSWAYAARSWRCVCLATDMHVSALEH